MSRRYIKFDFSRGYPSEPGLYYRCEICGDDIPTKPADNIRCTCRNLGIDVDYGRVSVNDHSKIRLYWDL